MAAYSRIQVEAEFSTVIYSENRCWFVLSRRTFAIPLDFFGRDRCANLRQLLLYVYVAMRNAIACNPTRAEPTEGDRSCATDYLSELKTHRDYVPLIFSAPWRGIFWFFDAALSSQ